MLNKKTTQGQVLIVGHDNEYIASIIPTLNIAGFDITQSGSIHDAIDAINRNKIDIALIDPDISDGSFTDIIDASQSSHREINIIILSEFEAISGIADSYTTGCLHYLHKTGSPEELLFLVKQGINSRKTRAELNNLREEIAWKYSFDNFIGQSKQVRQVKSLAARVAETDVSILINGQAGTGKEHLAKAIHFHSQRRKSKFTSVDCSSIPNHLLESELFGHKAGAFDGAYDNHVGILKRSDGGTIYLSEIGDLSGSIQTKLLQVLEKSEILPIGSDEPYKINIRIIAATNENLPKLVTQGKFREDLYYRLNIMPLSLLPLCKRPDDIALLVEHFLREESKSGNLDKLTISIEAMEKLMAHSWPGNVRELLNTIKRATALSRDGHITTGDIMFISTERSANNIVKSIEISDSDDWTLEESLKQRIESTLYATDWNYTRTAAKLGIGRTTLWRKIRKYNITRGEENAKTTVTQ